MTKMKDLGSTERASDELEGKDQSNKAYIENKRGIELGSIYKKNITSLFG
jgi:hypothetical protein